MLLYLNRLGLIPQGFNGSSGGFQIPQAVNLTQVGTLTNTTTPTVAGV